MKKQLKIVTLILVLAIAPFFTESAIAQPPPPKPKDIPLDGGLSALLVAGLVYGGRKLYASNSVKEEMH